MSIFIGLLYLVPIFAYDLPTAKSWLTNEINANTLMEKQNDDIALPYQSAKEAVVTALQVGILSNIDRDMFLAPYRKYDENATEFLSDKIIVSKALGEDTSAIMGRLLALQNLDGGFGHSAGHQSSVLDTAYALSALALTNENISSVRSAVDFLIHKQKADGSWSDLSDTDVLFTTSIVLRSLWQQRKNFALSDTLEKAKDFLVGTPVSDETFIDAVVLRAIAPFFYDKQPLIERIDRIKLHQMSDGSWNESIYTTALAIQALDAADKDVPNPDLGSVTGFVSDGDTGVLLSNIEVILASDINQTLTTSSDGKFFFDGIKNGVYILHILSSNYAPLHTTLNISGDDINLGTLRLNKNVNSTISTLTGVIKDSQTNLPIEGAIIRVGNIETQTDSSGVYTIPGIEAGTYTVSIIKTGYLQEDRSINLPANTILRYDAVLRDFDFTVSANILGTIIDGNTSLPLSDVLIRLSDNNTTKTYTTTSTGSFEFKTLSQGTYHLEIKKDGYYGVQTTFNIDISNTIDFGIIELHAVNINTPQFASVQGIIADVVTKKPIENALVEVSGLHTMTSSEGTYNIENVPVGEMSIKISKDGYKTVSASATLSPGSTLIFSPLLQKDDGMLKLYGTILDSNSSEPLSDVNISISDTNLTAFTDANGSYLIENIPNGVITIEVSKFGYRTVKVTTTVHNKSIAFSPTLQRNGSISGSTTLYGRVVDTASGEVLNDVSFYINNIDTGIKSDSEGNFTIGNINNTDINLTLKKDGYKDVNTVIYIDQPQDINLGTLFMRSNSIEELKPDLVVEAINTSGIESDIHTLQTSGELNITIANRGTVPSDTFDITVFYDRNADGNFSEQIDNAFGHYQVDGMDIDESKVISLDVNTTADFRDQPIYVYIDSKNKNVELDENNTYNTAKSCGGKQGKIDLGICFDYSGSVGSLANLQKNGLIQALRDPTKFPRDGSIRLTIMTVQRTQLEPTIITNDNAEDIADKMSNTYFYGSSYVDDCLKVMADKLNTLPNQSSYKAITLSGDGYWGGGITYDRDYAVSKGINVIDAIAVGYSLNWNTLNSIVYPQPEGGTQGVVYRATTAEEVSNSLVRTFQKQTRISDLTLGKLKIIDKGLDHNISIEFTVGNAGVATIPSDINISVYEGDPQKGGVFIASTHLDANLSFGNSKVLSIDNIALQEGGEIFVIADDGNKLVECTKENNTISSIVSPTSTLGEISTNTDKSSYTDNEIVKLSASIFNPGRLSYKLSAQLILQDGQGNVIETFDEHPLGIVASQETKEIFEEWNTTTTLTGEYVLKGVLKDRDGNIVDESNTSFSIVSGSQGVSLGELALSTDRYRYLTSDSMTITNVVKNISPNSVIKGAKVRIKLVDPQGRLVMEQNLTAGDLLPESTREIDTHDEFARLPEGIYTLQASLYDQDGTLYDKKTVAVMLYEQTAMAIKGSVSLAWNENPVGTTQECTYGLSSFSSIDPLRSKIQLRLIDFQSGSIKRTIESIEELRTAQSITKTRSLSTKGLNKGAYSCALYVKDTDDTWKLLDHRMFRLTNTPPIAENDTIETDENTPVVIDVLENDYDNEDDIDRLHITIVDPPRHGSVSIVDGKVTYRPQINFSGKDHFAYVVSDSGGLVSHRADVDIYVPDTNKPPVAKGQSLTVDKNGYLDIVLSGEDSDGDDLAYQVVRRPKHGALRNSPPDVLYVPKTNYVGDDYFAFKVNDGAVDSNVAVVNIRIRDKNHVGNCCGCQNYCGCSYAQPSVTHQPVSIKLKVASVTANSATIEWEDTTKHRRFYVVYLDGNAVEVLDPDINRYTIEGLSAESNHTVYLKVYTDTGSGDSPSVSLRSGNWGWLPAIYLISHTKGDR